MNTLHLGRNCPEALLRSLETASSFNDVFDLCRALSYHSDCQVTVARIKSSGQQVVVKTYLRHKLKDTSLLQVQTEALIHSTLAHPHVVQLFAAFEDAKHVYMVVEYADGGDLRKHMVGLPERRVRDFIAAPLLMALALLHQQGIVHRDLKPDNVLVHHNKALLADFGLAMYCAEAPPTPELLGNAEQAAACACLANNAGGTPLYTAPEVLLAMFKSEPMQSVVQPKNDVWALGILVLEALSGSHPFSPENCSTYNGNVMYTIAHHKSVNLPSNLSPEVKDFLAKALQRDPGLRPTAEELLHHPWVNAAARRDSPAAGHCRALSAELPKASCASERPNPVVSGLSACDLLSDAGTPTKCHQSVSKHHLEGGMHRAYSAFEMVECWEQ